MTNSAGWLGKSKFTAADIELAIPLMLAIIAKNNYLPPFCLGSFASANMSVSKNISSFTWKFPIFLKYTCTLVNLVLGLWLYNPNLMPTGGSEALQDRSSI
jgi:hypothetical protein